MTRYLLFFLFVTSPVFATEKPLREKDMNGYSLSSYAGFERKWKLVTVRFRKDTGEMRFTYANDLAFKSLVRGTKDYPDGAVFAKISQKTEADPSFDSSSVPSGARRYQYMVRNKTKHANTDGWGYALFDKDGIVFPEKIETQSASCAACHRLVPEKGYVFSELMTLSPDHGLSESSKKRNQEATKLTYATTSVSLLDPSIRSLLPRGTEEFQNLTHELRKHLFQGALDEIKPSLAREAFRAKRPALVSSEDQKTFAIVFIENFEIQCESEGKNGYFVKAISSSKAQKGKIYENRYCWVD